MAFNYFANTQRDSAFKAWEEEEKRKAQVLASPASTKDFKGDSRLVNNRFSSEQYKSDNGKMYAVKSSEAGKSYKWESQVLHDLDRSWGRNYTDKFNNLMSSMGVEKGEAKQFRKFLDAQEKGALVGDYGAQMMQAVARAKFNSTEQKDNTPIVPNERGVLNRVFSPLLIGNYTSASIANNVFNKKEGWKGAWEGLKDGVKASNPFGDGHKEGEMTYSKVFKEAGWKPKSTAGKIGQGTAGFIADVLLDPTTYMTFGASAVLKGTGRSAVSAKNLAEAGVKLGLTDDALKVFKKGTMTPEVAKKIVSEQAQRTGKVLDEGTLTAEADRLTSRFHSVLGTNREGVGLGVGLKHSIANPLIKFTVGKMDNKVGRAFNALADSHVELPGSAKVAQTIGQYTPNSFVYSKIRKSVYGTQIGKLFSSKYGLMELAKSDPAKIYDVMDMVAKAQGFQGDKVAKEVEINDYVKQNLTNLSPADQKKLIDALQDKTILSTIQRVTKIGNYNEAKQLRNQMERERQLVQTDLDNLSNQMNDINTLRSKAVQDLDGGKEAVRVAEREYQTALANLDLSKIKNKEQYDTAIKMLQQQADELEVKYGEAVTPLKPKEEVLNVEEPIAPKRPYTKNPKKPELDGVPEKPAYPEAPKLSDYVKDDVTELQYNGSGVLDKWEKAFYKNGKGETRAHLAKRNESIDELSTLLFGSAGKISNDTYDREIGEIVKMINEGRNSNFIKAYIESKPHQFDGRAKKIDSYVASLIGYGSGKQFKTWDEYYTQRVEKVMETARKRGTSPSQKESDFLGELEKDKVKRAILRAQMMEKHPADLNKFLAERRLEETLRWADDVENREFKGRILEKDEARRAGQDIARDFDFSDKKKIKENAEQKFQDEKNTQMPGVAYLSDVDKDDVTGRLWAFLADKKKQSFDEFMPSEAQRAWADSVIQKLPYILNKNFGNKNYVDLSYNAQKFAIGLATRDALSASTGSGAKSGDELIKKRATERATTLAEFEHAQAVRAQVTKGNPVVIKDGKNLPRSGRITEIHENEFGTATYTVVDKKGNVHTDVQAKQFIEINKAKPVETLLENTMEDMILKSLEHDTKAYEAKIKQLDEIYNAELKKAEGGNAEKLAQYEKEVAQVEAERQAKKEQYEIDLAKFKADRENFMSEAERVLKVNEASLADWEKAVRDSSKMADEYFSEKQAIFDKIKSESTRRLQNDLSLSGRQARVHELLGKRYEKAVQNVVDLERTVADMDSQFDDTARVMSSDDVKNLQAKFDELDNALRSDEAFETFIQLKHSEDLKKWDKKYGNGHVGQTVLDASSDYSDTVKRLAHELRANFKVFGADEVKAGKLTEEQFASWVDEYLPHLVTPSGSAFFKKWKLQYNESTGTVEKVARTKRDGQPSVTQDLGYGEVFNEFGLSRSIKKLKMPDGTWVERPTISQINEVMKPFLKGDNAFSENIADIFVARAMKHNELMYDEKYMNEMMRTFGRELPADLIPEAGHKAVMNFGLFKRNLNELSNLQVSIHISEDVGEYVKSTLAPRLGRGLSPDELEKEVGKYIQSKYTPDVMEQIKNDFHNEGYSMLGLERDTFRSIATPMVEVSPEQITTLQQKYNDVLGQFANNLTKQQDNAARYGASPAQMERIKKSQDKLANLSQLEYKQVHESIVQKANQARQLQIAKDGNNLVKMYDKFTHFMKLNQTAIMPSFHMRNAYSNLFQVWLAVGNDVWDMQTHKNAFKTNMKKGSLEELKHLEPLIVRNNKGQEIQRMDWDEVYRLAQSHGVINEGFFAKDLSANDASNGLIKGLHDVKVPKSDDVRISLDPTDTKNFIGYKAGGGAGSFVENQARLFQFASHIKQGMTPEQSKAMVDKYLFDYGDLTAFEQTVMKRIFPYYTWLRKNARLQVSQVLEQPGKYRDVAKWMNSIDGGIDEEDKVQDQYLSNFAKNWVQTPFNFTSTDEEGNETVEPILWSPNLPFMDLTRLPSLNPLNQDQTIMNMLPQMNPLIKGIAELGTNKNFFFDDKIVEDEYYNADSGEMEPATMGQRLGKYAEYGASQLAPVPAIRDAFKKEGLDKKLHLLNTVAGQKYLSYDYEKSKDMAIQKYMNPPKGEDVQWVDKQLSALDNLPRNVQGKVTKKLVNHINKQPKTWVAKTVEGTSLEKYLLGNDIATAKVLGVRDGDTLDVEINGKKEGVRFNLIDTPEISHNAMETAMPFADEASSLTKSLTDGKNVRLVISKQKDMHGRLMAYVYVDGEDLNRKLLEEGLASVRYANLSTNPYNEKEYRKVQEEASKSGKGLWQLDGYADPEKEGYNKRGAMKKYLELMGGE